MTVHLRVLGPLELVADDGGELRRILQQPKRLALLAFLALRAPNRFQRRDTLLALFWPDLDTEHARAALRRSLYFLRKELGDGILVGRSEEEVGLAAERLECDAIEFETAATRGDHDAALRHYRGPLLEGSFVAGAPEVVDWLDGERARLRELALRSAWSLAEGPHAPAAVALQWGRWAANVSPDDESNVARYIALLMRLGERGAALRAYRELERRLDAQFGAAPSPATRRLLDQAPVLVEPQVSKTMPPAIAPTEDEPSGSGDELIPLEDPRLVVVAPFDVRGGADLQYLREGVMELLSGALADAGDVRAMDAGAVLTELRRRPQATGAELAAFFRAPRYVDGTVFEAGGRLRIMAALRATATRAVLARGEAEAADETGLFRLVDDVLRQLVTSLPAGPGSRLLREAALSAGSIPALKAFLRAERDFRLGRLFDAISGFAEATRHDASFGVAHYRHASALAAAAQVAPARASCARALATRGFVSEREWAHFSAQEAWLAGNAQEAELRYGSLVAQWPEDVEANYLLGDLRMHTNPDRGRSILDAKAPLKRTLVLDPGHIGARVKLARLAGLQCRTARLADHVERVIALSPDGDQTLAARALRAWACDDGAGQAQVLDALRTSRALTIMIAFADVAVYGGDLAKAERFGRALAGIIESDELRTVALLVRAWLGLARGRIDAGMALLREAGAARPAWAHELAALAAAGSIFPADVVPLAAMHEEMTAADGAADPMSRFPLLAIHDGIHGHLRLYLLGKLEARLGHMRGAAEAAEALAEEPVAGEATVLVSQLLRDLTATIRELGGRSEEGLHIRLARAPAVWYQFAIGSPFLGGVEHRFRMGDALAACGREGEAIGWFASIAERSPWELPWKAPATHRLAAIFDRLGDEARAAEHYRRFISLWQDADETLQPLVQAARMRLVALDGHPS